jgi:hypothetical protein
VRCDEEIPLVLGAMGCAALGSKQNKTKRYLTWFSMEEAKLIMYMRGLVAFRSCAVYIHTHTRMKTKRDRKVYVRCVAMRKGLMNTYSISFSVHPRPFIHPPSDFVVAVFIWLRGPWEGGKCVML